MPRHAMHAKCKRFSNCRWAPSGTQGVIRGVGASLWRMQPWCP
jgi:hypothetical protein